MSLGYWETLAACGVADGTALTAAARASLLQGAAKRGLYTMQPNYLRENDILRLRAWGRVSCVITTPGTARFDLSYGVGGTAMFDSLAMPMNIVAKTNVMWNLDVEGVVRGVGNSAAIFWGGWWLSEASINTAVPSTGPGPGGQNVPYNTAPVVGTTFDQSLAGIIDFNWTQTVATGSITLHGYSLSKLTATGF